MPVGSSRICEGRLLHPVSLRSLIQGLVLLDQSKKIDVLEEKANVTKRRASEIVEELIDLGLVKRNGEDASATELGVRFLSSYKQSAWKELHEILYDGRLEYRTVTRILRENSGSKGLTISEICQRRGKISINVVTTEVCLEWGLRLGVFQKNLYTSGMNSRYYCVSNESEKGECFRKKLLELYGSLNVKRYGRRVLFVSIPELRELVCEELRIRRQVFDDMFREVYLEKTDKIELCGGPLTGTARKAPTGKLSIFVDRSSLLMAPSIALEQQEGLRLRGRVYQMVAFLR